MLGRPPRNWRRCGAAVCWCGRSCKSWRDWPWRVPRPWDLEMAAEKMMADAGAKPAFKGYYVPAAGEAYKFVLCTSVNSEIVHGMPNPEAGAEEGRHRFHRHRGEAGRVLRRFGPHGAGRRDQRADQEAPEGNPGVAWNWPSTRCGPATGCSTFAGRWKSTSRPTGFRSCGSMWATGSAPSFTRSRRFPITWTARTRIPG